MLYMKQGTQLVTLMLIKHFVSYFISISATHLKLYFMYSTHSNDLTYTKILKLSYNVIMYCYIASTSQWVGKFHI